MPREHSTLARSRASAYYFRIKVVEYLFRVSAALVLLVNALVPSVALADALSSRKSAALSGQKAESSGQKDSPSQSPPNTILPVTYQPPPIHRPDRFGPTPDLPDPIVPAKSQVEFSLTTDSSILDANGQITLKVFIRNNSTQEADNLIFTDPLEAGLQYVSGSSSSLTYDSQKQDITLSIPKLAAGEELSFNYVLGTTTSKRASVMGRLWLHVVQLDSAQGNVHLKANTPFGGGLSVGNAKSSFAAFNPDGGWNGLGRFSIYMEKDAIDPDSTLIASPLLPSPAGGPTGVLREGAGGGVKGPPLQFKLDVVKTAKLNKDSQGKLAAQTIDLGQVSTAPFKHPAFLEINLDGYVDLNHVPGGMEPYVATYDEVNQVWVKVPILAKDIKANKVTVQANHFSTWGAGLGTSLPQNGANVLLFDSHYTSLFTGAARYSIPIWTPPGRAGMAPDISLSYSSATVDGVLGNVQAPWVGEGWNIDGVEIVRKITTSDAGYGYQDGVDANGVSGYTLSINGATYELLVDPNHPNRYYTKQGSFLYVERHNDALGNNTNAFGNTIENIGHNPNVIKTDEWWEVVTTDGTRYFLGSHPDSEQLALMYGYSCTTGSPCTTPDGAYASLGYAGNLKNLVALRWRVDKVTDVHGNYMTYSYYEEHPSSSLVPQFDRASYLQSISYTGHVDGLQPGYQVNFVHGNRSGDATPAAFNVWDNYDTQQLNEIDACYGTCASGTIVRKYQLNYSVANAPDPNGTLTLSSIQISGGGFSEQGINIPATSSATIRFTYSNLDNRAVTGSDNKYPYPRLTSIANGYGGILTYTYENDGRGASDWYDWRVKTVNVANGVTASNIKGYTYVTPLYAGANNTGELIGYTDTTETTYAFDGTTKIRDVLHHFGTVGLDVGYELSTQWNDASGTAQRKVANVYVTDNSKAPFSGWNYRYLYQVTNYVRSGSALAQVSQTQYINDPSTGSLVEQDTYLGSTLLRKGYYEYWPNFNPTVYILDKPTRQVTVDAGNTIFADTRYGYDGIANFRSTSGLAISKGDLTLVQKLSDATHTSDAAASYDNYGNPISACAYKAYGSPGVAPSGACESSSTTYDSTLHTYAVQSTNALNQSSTTNYLYTLGVPYQVTDPNGWTTTTTYDGLGRTLSVTPPGLSQAGVKYFYPAPDGSGNVSAPYSVQMQIWDTRNGSSGVYRKVWGIYDGLGRTVQSQVQDDDLDPRLFNHLLVTDTAYNAQGLVSQQSLPYLSTDSGRSGGDLQVSSASQYTTTTYDALGRAIQVTAPGNISTTTAYDGLTTTVTDPNGNKIARTSDGLGRLTMVQEYSGGSVYATTRYSYDIADHLKTTTDAQSNVTTLIYDWLGRKTGMQDPDMGGWFYQYDPLGNLKQQTDARSQVLTFNYDDLNRLTLKHDATNNVDLASYGYGSTAGTIGMRTSMNDQSGSTAWSYDNYGRTVTETRTIGAVTNQAAITTSDWLGRVLTVSYPDGETLTYQYDALGRARNFSSSAQSGNLADLAYNTLSQLTTVNLRNNVAVTNAYDSNTDRLSERSAALGSTKLMDFSYLYDQAGNITTITDSVLGETHTYQYDSLNRLTSAEATKGQDHPYRQTFQYDQIGNIQQVANWQSSDVIFRDDFEDASLAAWSSVVQNAPPADIWTMDAGAFKPVTGQKSLLVEVNDDNAAYVSSSSPSGGGTTGPIETYRARFYFHPNHLSMAGGDVTELFNGRTSTASVVRISLQYAGGVYQVRAGLLNNSGVWTDGSWYTIGNQWNALEINWQSASQNGTLSLWVNGAFKQTLGPVDNGGKHLSEARLGAVNVLAGTRVPSDTRGQILFDAFESRRLTYIGLLPTQTADAGMDRPAVYHPEQSAFSPQTSSFSLQPSSLNQVLDTDTPTPTVTDTPTLTAMASPTGTMTPSQTPSATPTATGTPTPSNTPTATATFTKTLTPSQTMIPTSTNTATATRTPTSVPFASAISWTYDTTVEGWFNINTANISGFGWQTGGYIGGTIIGGDPYIYSADNLGINITSNKTIKIRLNNSTASSIGQFYFITTTDAAWDEAKHKNFTIVPNSGYTEYVVDMSTVSGWTGTLRQLRLDPEGGASTGSFSVDYILIGTLNPTVTPTPTPTTLTPTFTSTATLTPTATTAPALAAKWSFDETSGATVYDSTSGAQSNGTLNGSVLRVPGFGVNALQFTAAGQYVSVPRTSELEPANGFTISAWVYPTQLNSGTNYVILNKGGSSQDYRLYINSRGFLVFHIQDLIAAGSATPTATPTPPANTADLLGPILPLNAWSHIAAEYDPAAGLMKMYLNGTLVASKQISGTIVYDTTQGLTIIGSANPFIGILDEVQLYSGVLADSQITGLSKLSLTATPNPTWTPLYTNTPTLTPTNTPAISPTPLPSGNLPWGTGSDGDLTVASGVTYNINTQNHTGRSCADGGDAVAYSVTSLGSTAATLSSSPATGCLNPGDEILLINLQGTTATTYNTGVYEFLRVYSVSGSQVTFTTSKVNWYGDGWRSDNGIGVGAGQQRVMLMRVPNYNNVTVNGTLTANAWNEFKNGVVAFRVNGSFTGAGIVSVNGLGYIGGDNTTATNGYGGGSAGHVPNSGGGYPYSGRDGECTNLRWGGAGGYGTAGQSFNGAAGGQPYGVPQLSLLYLGGAAGTNGAEPLQPSGDQVYCGVGSRGGGILLLAARTIINFTGSLQARGGNSGAGGAGGSIRIEGDNITLSTLSTVDASGGSAGGQGRIAVYYQTSLSGLNSTPSAYTALLGQPPTPTPSPTPIGTAAPDPYGTGADGDLTIASGATFNLSTQYSGTRTCADGISYPVIELNNSYARLSAAPPSGCLKVGDELLLINLQGASTSYANAGNYEFLRVGGIISDIIYFKTSKTKYYGANVGDDTNIGTGAGQQRVMVYRVPNYRNMTVNGTLTTNAWNGAGNGIVVFRVSGTLTGAATSAISANGLGYRGGVSMSTEYGESYAGLGLAGFGGGAPGGRDYDNYRGYGGGGAYGTNGSMAGLTANDGAGGAAYGNIRMLNIFFGSGGGAGGQVKGKNGNPDGPGETGSAGGGIVIVFGHTISFQGNISSIADPNYGKAGWGAGGAVRIEGYDISLNTVTVSGAGNGGRGRLVVYYQNSFSGNFTPHYLQKQDTPDSIFQDDFDTGSLAQWTSSVTDGGNLSASPALSYWGAYGLQAVINDNNNLYVQDDTPSNETIYRARFYLYPAGLSMGAADTLDIFDGYTAGTVVFKVQLQQPSAGTYQIRAGLLDNGTTWTYTNWYTLSPAASQNGWSAVEIGYWAFANSGGPALWLNGTLQQVLSQIDNSLRPLTEVRLGAQNVVSTTRGTLYFDNFESRRFSYIGTLPPPDLPQAQPASQAGWTPTNYIYSTAHPHAVSAAGANTYSYDANGNMTCRVENGDVFIQAYNAENRLASGTKVAIISQIWNGICPSPITYAAKWDFAYDGDGTRVTQLYTPYDSNGNPQTPILTVYFMGGAYEVTGGAVKKYYAIAGMTVAMNDGSGLKYLLTDHLGSVVGITDGSGTLISQQRYLPFGQVRTDVGSITQTDLSYTGQRALNMGLMDYKARMYDSALGRFLSADTIVPNPFNPQAFNRHAYTVNNPLRYIDPSGHIHANPCELRGDCPPPPPVNPCSLEPDLPQCRIPHHGGRGGQGGTGSLDSCTISDCGDYHGALQVLTSVNYNLGPRDPVTIYNGPTSLSSDLKVDWLPSVTINNGSYITLTPNGFIFGPRPDPFAPRYSITSSGLSVGYIDSPIIGGINSSTGMSIPFPQMPQGKLSINTTLQFANIQLKSTVNITSTSRPDRAAVIGAPIVVAGWYALRYQSGTLGQGCEVELQGVLIPC